MDYGEFIRSKQKTTPVCGFDVDELNPCLFEFQQAIVKWAIKRGRAALFLDTGLGKTLCQLEWAANVVRRTGKKVLIVAPLAVGPQTIREADKFGIDKDLTIGTWGEGDYDIQLTNYERLHKVDADDFVGVVLDESSILKSVAGKQRTRILEMFSSTPYRLACTATPAPNDVMELGNHAEFVGVMSRTEMLSMFFIHDGGETSKWRLKGHGEQKFWDWMAEWSVMIRKPSDIGFSDEGFTLPELRIHEHIVETDTVTPGHLFKTEAVGLHEQRQVRKETIGDRTSKIAELINRESEDQWIVWCGLNEESKSATSLINGSVEVTGSHTEKEKEERLLSFINGQSRVLVTKSRIAGFGLNLQFCNKMAFLGMGNSYESFYQSVRRIWRFGQKKPCDVNMVISDRDSQVLHNIQRKQSEHDKMASGMVEAMAKTSRKNVVGLKRDEVEYKPEKQMHLPEWLQVHS